MKERIIFIGGYKDGQEIEWENPGPILKVVAPRSLDILLTEESYPTHVIETLDYYQIYDSWYHPSRDDEGRLRYMIGRHKYE